SRSAHASILTDSARSQLLISAPPWVRKVSSSIFVQIVSSIVIVIMSRSLARPCDYYFTGMPGKLARGWDKIFQRQALSCTRAPDDTCTDDAFSLLRCAIRLCAACRRRSLPIRPARVTTWSCLSVAARSGGESNPAPPLALRRDQPASLLRSPPGGLICLPGPFCWLGVWTVSARAARIEPVTPVRPPRRTGSTRRTKSAPLAPVNPLGPR